MLSKTQTSVLDFGRRYLVFLDLLIEGASRDSQSLGGLLDAAFFFLENSFDVLFLKFDQRQTRVEKWRPYIRMAIEVEISQSYSFVITKEHRSLDHVS